MEQPEVGGRKLNVGSNERLLSIGVGALLALIVLRRSWRSMLLAGIGSYLVYRGVTGNCRVYEALNVDTSGARRVPDGEPIRSLAGGIKIQRAVTVNRSPAEVYLFWRNLENLPRFMHHLQSVEMTGTDTSHWVANTRIAGVPLSWDARITEERPNELIAWGALPGSTVMNTGAVRFMPAPGHRGTEVHVTMEYAPPGGPLAAAAARLLNKITAQSVKEDLRRFKEVMEAGEVANVEGQPSGRSATAGGSGRSSGQGRTSIPAATSREGTRTPSQVRHRNVVDEASYESFPASDPPSYSQGLG